MFFEKFKRNKWLKKINADCGPLDNLEKEFSALRSNHLSTLAEISSKLREHFSEYKSSSQLVLRVLTNDPYLIDKLTGIMRDKFSERLVRMVDDYINILLNRVHEKVSSKIPKNCSLDEKACYDFLKESLQTGMDENKTIESLEKKIKSDPEPFVCGYRNWANEREKKIVQKILKDITIELERNLLKEFSVNNSTCEDKIMNLVHHYEFSDPFILEISYDTIIERFYNLYKSNPESFIDGIGEWFDKKAEELINQIPLFSKSLPKGITLNRVKCVRLLGRTILKLGYYDPSMIVKKFITEINKNPIQYFLADGKTFFDILRSSAPYSSDRDHSMLSTSIRYPIR